jgi:UDP-N-acetylmuramyl pentapeptide phosphotransferase/UDP-N-acetylglucosamine-1-phosphate transferase
LAGGLSALTLAALALLAIREDMEVALQLASMVAAIVGFLVFNSRFFGRKRAAIFMGDGGSIFIGFAIVWYLIQLSQGPNAVITPVSALWLFAVPLLDTLTIMIRRISKGNSPSPHFVIGRFWGQPSSADHFVVSVFVHLDWCEQPLFQGPFLGDVLAFCGAFCQLLRHDEPCMDAHETRQKLSRMGRI